MLHRLSIVGLFALATACAADAPERARRGGGPVLGAADGGDSADHACHIVLRELARVPATGGYASECVDGACWFVWQGYLDVSDAAIADGAVPEVTYQSGSDPSWWVVSAEPAGAGTAGYQRFSFRIAEHTVGPGMSTTSLMRTRIQVAPYLVTAGGGRLFDHNRNPGDFDNYWLTSDNAWAIADDPTACRAAAQPVELVSAQVVTRVDYPNIMRTSLIAVVRAGGVDPDEAVTLHYQIREGDAVARDWSTVAATRVDGATWELATPVFEGTCPHYCPRHVFQLAIAHTSGGTTTWDNNGGPGLDYVLANDIGGSVPVYYGPPAILDGAVQVSYADWLPDARAVRGEVVVANLAYDKRVTIWYTTDDWATVREAPAQFSRSSFDDLEYWQFHVHIPDAGARVQLAVRYEVAGQTHWDNDLGRDYQVVTAP